MVLGGDLGKVSQGTGRRFKKRSHRVLLVKLGGDLGKAQKGLIGQTDHN